MNSMYKAVLFMRLSWDGFVNWGAGGGGIIKVGIIHSKRNASRRNLGMCFRLLILL